MAENLADKTVNERVQEWASTAKWPPDTKPIGCGLHNLGNTCFVNSVLQCLTHTPPLALGCLQTADEQVEVIPGGLGSGRVMRMLAEHIREALTTDERPFAPSLASHMHEVSGDFTPGQQEDSHEFVRLLIDAATRQSPAERKAAAGLRPFVEALFLGQLRSTIRCKVCGKVSSSREDFLDLSLEIRADGADGAVPDGGSVGARAVLGGVGAAAVPFLATGTGTCTLADALLAFLRSEELEDSDCYYCARCKARVRAEKQLCLQHLPVVLLLHLKRFRQQRWGRSKIHTHVPFPVTLDLHELQGRVAQADAAARARARTHGPTHGADGQEWDEKVSVAALSASAQGGYTAASDTSQGEGGTAQVGGAATSDTNQGQGGAEEVEQVEPAAPEKCVHMNGAADDAVVGGSAWGDGHGADTRDTGMDAAGGEDDHSQGYGAAARKGEAGPPDVPAVEVVMNGVGKHSASSRESGCHHRAVDSPPAMAAPRPPGNIAVDPDRPGESGPIWNAPASAEAPSAESTRPGGLRSSAGVPAAADECGAAPAMAAAEEAEEEDGGDVDTCPKPEGRYTLYAVIVHHGRTIASGHYIAYVHSLAPPDGALSIKSQAGGAEGAPGAADPQRMPGRWWCYDDSHAYEVDEEHVLQQPAYMCFYVHESWWQHAPVVRAPPPAAQRPTRVLPPREPLAAASMPWRNLGLVASAIVLGGVTWHAYLNLGMLRAELRWSGEQLAALGSQTWRLSVLDANIVTTAAATAPLEMPRLEALSASLAYPALLLVVANLAIKSIVSLLTIREVDT